MSEDLEQLGRRIRDVRDSLGLSRETIAQAAGVSASTVKRLETGKDIRASCLLAIIGELGRRGVQDIGLEARVQLLPEEGRQRVLDLIQWYEGRATRRSR